MTMFDTVLLDVNGTLLPAGPTPSVDETTWNDLRAVLTRIRAAGITVGLCSDSPVDSLTRLGSGLDLVDFPVIAENGNVLVLRGNSRLVSPFPDATSVQSVICNLADAHSLVRLPDVFAPEFGGSVVGEGYWAFGAGRRASLSVFAGPSFIEDAGVHVLGWAHQSGVELSVDSSPHNGFLGVHPYFCRLEGKRKALEELARQGRKVLMIGDSLADWSPDPFVCCAFVATAKVPQSVRGRAWAVSDRSDTEGVIDLLLRVLARAVKE